MGVPNRSPEKGGCPNLGLPIWAKYGTAIILNRGVGATAHPLVQWGVLCGS